VNITPTITAPIEKVAGGCGSVGNSANTHSSEGAPSQAGAQRAQRDRRGHFTKLLDWMKYYYLSAAWWLHLHVTSSPLFEAFIMCNILAVAVSTGMSLNGADSEDIRVAAFVEWVNAITFVVFIVEATMKIVAFGPNPHHYFIAPFGDGLFNCFDVSNLATPMHPQNCAISYQHCPIPPRFLVIDIILVD
jgi:hypothetical protein